MRLVRPYDVVLDSAAGWRGLDVSAAAREDGALHLAPVADVRPHVDDPLGTFGGHTVPRGVAAHGDRVLMADPPRNRILSWVPCCGGPAPLPMLSRSARGLREPRGLTIVFGGLAVADAGRVLLLTVPGWVVRWIGRPCAPWKPVDVAAGHDGTLLVADADGRIWRLDAQGRPDPRYDGRLAAGEHPLRVLGGRDGRAYVVVGPSPRGVRILDRYGKPLPSPRELPASALAWLAVHVREIREGTRLPSAAELDTARAALVGDDASQRLNDWLRRRELDPADANAMAAAWDAVLPDVVAAALPASPLHIDGSRVQLEARGRDGCPRAPLDTDLVARDDGRLWLEGLVDGPPLAHPKPPLQFPTGALLRLDPPLDSGAPGNPWHRIVLELDLPQRTGARLFSLTSDVPRASAPASGLLDEPPQLGDWRAAPDGAREWLVQSPPGRYLHLALALKGPGDRTPAVERLFVYARRDSSLRYLPATYSEDETAASVLDRLLSLFDTVLAEVETQIEDLPVLLDSRGVPAEFLPWLASWFDLVLEPEWDEQRRRAVLADVLELYQRRGTVAGLRRLLELHTGLAEGLTRIVEHHRGVGVPGLERWLGDVPGGDAEHHFSVLLPGRAMDSETKRETLRRLVADAAPAHTHFGLRRSDTGVRLAGDEQCGSALGLDAVVTSHGVWRLDTDRLGSATALADRHAPAGTLLHVGHTRLPARARSASSTITEGRRGA